MICLETGGANVHSDIRAGKGFPGGASDKESACNAGDQLPSLGWEDSLEEETATHSSILAWKVPWKEEPGGLQSIESQRVAMTKAT